MIDRYDSTKVALLVAEPGILVWGGQHFTDVFTDEVKVNLLVRAFITSTFQSPTVDWWNPNPYFLIGFALRLRIVGRKGSRS